MNHWEKRLNLLKKELDAGSISFDDYERQKHNLLDQFLHSSQSGEMVNFPDDDETNEETHTEHFNTTETIHTDADYSTGQWTPHFLGISSPLSPATIDDDKESIGQYYLLEKIGEGGMGIVYRGRHKVEEFAKLTGNVAIKVMSPRFTLDEEFRLRFMSEANFGRTINHPNIVRIYDVLFDGGQLALVMDLIEGHSLQSKLKNGPLSVEKALELFYPLCSALDYLNSLNIVHRDIKPDNIIITEDNRPVILDMGIALGATGDINTTGNIAIGTPNYMPPEQIDAKDVSGASDRYALAVMLYRCLEGKFPWPRKISRSDLISRKYNEIFAAMSSDIPPNIEDAIMKMLSIDQNERFSSAMEFWKALNDPRFSYPKYRIKLRQNATISWNPPPPSYELKCKGTISIKKKRSSFFGLFQKNKIVIKKVEKEVSLHLLSVAAGSFQMGSRYGSADERPIHDVSLQNHFFLSQTPITQELWEIIMGKNPSNFKETKHPVEQVSWNDCIQFCNKLSEKEGLEPAYTIDGLDIIWNKTANGYRLPTEAEWERAAREPDEPGTSVVDFRYVGANRAEDVAWFDQLQTREVQTKKPNGHDIYDMNGNVWEWCWDWYDAKYYEENEHINPAGAAKGMERVTRGGSWKSLAKLSRLTMRGKSNPLQRSPTIGFRIARNAF